MRRADSILEGLPAPPSDVASTDHDPSGVRRAPRRRVLVVDDEPLVGAALRRALSHHDVTLVDSGAGAIALIAEADRFDVVICDVMMPGTSGLDVYEAACALRPEMRSRFVFVTGGVPHEATRAFLASIESPVLHKPFDLRALRDAVRDAGEAGSRWGLRPQTPGPAGSAG